MKQTSWATSPGDPLLVSLQHLDKCTVRRLNGVWKPLWPQLMWRVLLTESNTMMLKKALLQKGVRPESVCSLLHESSDLKGRKNLPGAPMSPAFLYARGARQGSVDCPDIWNQVLDTALRELAGCWESEGTGFMLAEDYRKAQKEAPRFIW